MSGSGDVPGPTDGAVHTLPCTNPGCVSWVAIWLPQRMPKDHLRRELICGFCAAQKANELGSWKEYAATVDGLKRKSEEEEHGKGRMVGELQALKDELKAAEILRLEQNEKTKQLTEEIAALKATLIEYKGRFDLGEQITNAMQGFMHELKKNKEGAGRKEVEGHLEGLRATIEELKNDLETKQRMFDSVAPLLQKGSADYNKIYASNLEKEEVNEIAKNMIASCFGPVTERRLENLLKQYVPNSVGPLINAALIVLLDSPKVWDIFAQHLVSLATRPDLAAMDAVIAGLTKFASGISDQEEYRKSFELLKLMVGAVCVVHPSPVVFLLDVSKPLSKTSQGHDSVNYKSSNNREKDSMDLFASCLRKIEKLRGLDYVKKEWIAHGAELKTFFPENQSDGFLGLKFLIPVRVRLLLEEGTDSKGFAKYARDEAFIPRESEEFIEGFVQGVCDYCFVEEKCDQWKDCLRKQLPIFLELFINMIDDRTDCDGNYPNERYSIKENIQVKLIRGFQDALRSRSFPALFQMGDVLSILVEQCNFAHSHCTYRKYGFVITPGAIKSWANDGRAENEALRSCSEWL